MNTIDLLGAPRRVYQTSKLPVYLITACPTLPEHQYLACLLVILLVCFSSSAITNFRYHLTDNLSITSKALNLHGLPANLLSHSQKSNPLEKEQGTSSVPPDGTSRRDPGGGRLHQVQALALKVAQDIDIRPAGKRRERDGVSQGGVYVPGLEGAWISSVHPLLASGSWEVWSRLPPLPGCHPARWEGDTQECGGQLAASCPPPSTLHPQTLTCQCASS